MRELFSRKKPPNQPPQVPKLEVFIKAKDGATVEQALETVENANRIGPDRLRIATNKEIDQVLQTGAWKAIREAFPLWTGTGFAYMEPDKTFREGAERISSLDGTSRYYVVFIDSRTKERWLFPVPEEHLDVKNGILVAEHPDLSIVEDGNDRIIFAQDKEIDLVGRFPARFGRHTSDPKHGIPHGTEASDSEPNPRRLWRSYRLVSLVARDNSVVWDDYGRRLALDYRPSYGLGAAVVREKQAKLVFDDPDPYRGAPRLVVVGEEGKSGNGAQDAKTQTRDPRNEIQTSETDNGKVGWFDRAKRAIGF